MEQDQFLGRDDVLGEVGEVLAFYDGAGSGRLGLALGLALGLGLA
jgi:hypothetical protein